MDWILTQYLDYLLGVRPAMNQGTFKYNQSFYKQELSSLKLIHHNFRLDERHLLIM